MNNIDELIDIIKQLDNRARFDEIIKGIQIRHNMLLFSNHKKVILDQLQNNPTVFKYDNQSENWSLVEGKKEDTNNLYLKAESFNGGVAKLMKVLDSYMIVYKLTSKEPSVRLSVDTTYGKIGIYDRKKETKVRVEIPFTHPLSKSYGSIGGYLYNDNNIIYKNESNISVYFDEESFDSLAQQIKKTQSSKSFKISMDVLYSELKKIEELDPNIHDGSYELVQKTIDEYSKLKDLSNIDVKDMDYIYSITIGTWKTSNEIRKTRLESTHLSKESKELLNKLIDDIWEKACNWSYDNADLSPKKPGYGMFGTGFMSFNKKLSDVDSRRFIAMLIKISKMKDDFEIFNECEKTLNDDSFIGRGLKTGSASIMLHCLKPFVFPIINRNNDHGIIYERLKLDIKKIADLKTYIYNCRIIKKYRDENFTFKNYRILDMSIWALDSDDFDYKKYFHLQ